jgi:hypothetical protein
MLESTNKQDARTVSIREFGINHIRRSSEHEPLNYVM